jgi:hypothetical protein
VVDAGVGEIDEKVADPPATVTPLCAPTDADEESTSVTEAVAPLHPAGMLATVTAVTLPADTVQLLVTAESDPHAETAAEPAPSFVDVVVAPAAWATVGGQATAQSTTTITRAR